MAAISTKIFRGDQEDMLDYLMFACHEHKNNKPLTGFGRELVAVSSSWLEPLPGRLSESCGSPTRKASKGRKAAPQDRPQGTPSAARSKPRPVSAAAGRASDSGSVLPRTTFGSSPTRPPTCSLGSSPPAACPAFFSSPTPQSLPMPTTGLLSKASLAIQAFPCTFHPQPKVCCFAAPPAAA